MCVRDKLETKHLNGHTSQEYLVYNTWKESKLVYGTCSNLVIVRLLLFLLICSILSGALSLRPSHSFSCYNAKSDLIYHYSTLIHLIIFVSPDSGTQLRNHVVAVRHIVWLQNNDRLCRKILKNLVQPFKIRSLPKHEKRCRFWEEKGNCTRPYNSDIPNGILSKWVVEEN